MNEYSRGLQAISPLQKHRQFDNDPSKLDEQLIYLVELAMFYALAVIGALSGNLWLLTASVGMLIYLAKYRRE